MEVSVTRFTQYKSSTRLSYKVRFSFLYSSILLQATSCKLNWCLHCSTTPVVLFFSEKPGLSIINKISPLLLLVYLLYKWLFTASFYDVSYTIKSTSFDNFEVFVRGKYLKPIETWRVKYCKNDLKRVKFGDCETKWICFTAINKITGKSNKTSRGYSVCFGEKHRRGDNKSWNEDEIKNALF